VLDEYGFGAGDSPDQTAPILYLGTLARGFLYDAGKIVVVTDAEIFGRYKVQRPRRLKSPHALEISFAFDNTEKSARFTGGGPRAAALADKMSDAWIAFARDPSPRRAGSGCQISWGRNRTA